MLLIKSLKILDTNGRLVLNSLGGLLEVFSCSNFTIQLAPTFYLVKPRSYDIAETPTVISSVLSATGTSPSNLTLITADDTIEIGTWQISSGADYKQSYFLNAIVQLPKIGIVSRLGIGIRAPASEHIEVPAYFDLYSDSSKLKKAQYLSVLPDHHRELLRKQIYPQVPSMIQKIQG
jgi:hypothetical protein